MSSLWDRVAHRFATSDGEISDDVDDNLRIAWPALASQLCANVGSAAGRRARILDVGCGAGGLARLLERSGFEVVGLDTSERMILLANQQRGPHVTFRHGAVTDLAREERFDGIVSCMVLQFIRDVDECLGRLSEHLRQGGTLTFAVFNPDYVTSHLEAGRYFVEPAGRIELAIEEERCPVFTREAAEYEALLAPLGFVARDQLYPPFPEAPEAVPEYLIMTFVKVA